MKLLRKTAGIAATMTLLCCLSMQVFADNIKLDETYSVEIKKFKVKLDSAQHELIVNATWTFKQNPSPSDYIDSNIVISEIKKFLIDYPKKSDFFEVVNHNLTSYMIDRFKQLHGMTIRMTVPATKMDPYDHYTEVTASR